MILPLLLLAQLGAPPVLPIPGATPTPMARPAATPTPTYQDYDPSPAPRTQRRPVPVLRQPLAAPTPKARPTARPRPRPTRKPAWRPPRGTVYVDRSGIYPAAVHLRYGQPLRFMQAAGRGRLSLVAVDPHISRTGRLRSLASFPARLSADAKWTWLGDSQGFAHRHWPIAEGTALVVQPETFLTLHEDIWGPGVGYLWPARFLFYVATGDTWRKVIVTLYR